MTLQTNFIPTAVIGIYQHPDQKTYHLRNLRTGKMLKPVFLTLADAAMAQAELENAPEYRPHQAVLPQTPSPDNLDALLDAFSQELNSWNKLADHPLLKLGASHV